MPTHRRVPRKRPRRVLTRRKTAPVSDLKVGDVVSRRPHIPEHGPWIGKGGAAGPNDDWPQVGRVKIAPTNRGEYPNTIGLFVLVPTTWVGHNLDSKIPELVKGWWVPAIYYEKVAPEVAAFWALAE